MSPIRRFWLSNFLIGVLKFLFYQFGRIIWGYSRWHCMPVNRKPYVLHIIETVEEMVRNGTIGDGYMIEVGCGRGDIIGNIQYKRRIGMDIDSNVIEAAKFCHPEMDFYVGGMEDIPVDNIDVLIAVGWFHGMNPNDVHNLIQPVLEKTKVFIFDVFLDTNKEILSRYVEDQYHAYTHRGDFLCDGKFALVSQSDDFLSSSSFGMAMRHVEYWVQKRA